MNFAQSLLKWYTSANERQMPWKGEKDPYKIWLSEIILGDGQEEWSVHSLHIGHSQGCAGALVLTSI